MRTCLVFPGCHPRGGVERVVWETARHLSARHDVRLVCSDAKLDGLENVTIERADALQWPRALRPVWWKRAASRQLRRRADELVVSYGAECPPGDVLVVQSVHRSWLRRGRSVTYGRIELPGAFRYALPRHDVLLALEAARFRPGRYRLIVAVADNVAADLRELYDVPPERIAVVPNGYSASQCSPERSHRVRDGMRAEIGLHRDDVALLLVANEWHRKGLAVLLEAAGRIGSAPVHVVLVGKVPPTAFTGQIRRLGLAERVHYCGPAEDVGLFYAAADVFVMPSQYEAFGSVIVEALASGLPVVTTRVAGAAAAVKEGVNGLLQEDPDDAGELAELLRTALEPTVREKWRQAAAPSVRHYEWSVVMGTMERLLTDLSGNGTPAAGSYGER